MKNMGILTAIHLFCQWSASPPNFSLSIAWLSERREHDSLLVGFPGLRLLMRGKSLTCR
jgi:hypothetical protein